MESRGYHDGVRWIEIALEQYPDYDAENAPDFHSLVDELGDAPPEGVLPEYLIGKGGEGSGHHDHEGRPGEVGGSLPSGVSGGAAKVSDDVERKYKNEEFGARMDEQIDFTTQSFGAMPSRIVAITDDERLAAELVMDSEIEYWREDHPDEGYPAFQRLKDEAKIADRLKRLGGGMIPAGGDDVVLFIDEEKTAGEWTTEDRFGGEVTLVGEEGETEFVVSHEMAHAAMYEKDENGNRRIETKTQLAHLNWLEEKYPHRMEEMAVPKSYYIPMLKLYGAGIADMNKIEREFYADMISYGVRLEQNPDEERITIRGDHTITVDDWYETDEDPRELARTVLGAVREYYTGEGKDA
jgi:hypothetical protein